jgi:hypothetical protein
MNIFFEVPGLNVYLQIFFTLLSIGIHLYATRGRRREPLVQTIAHFTIGLSGWFTIISGLFGHIIYADEVAAGIGWPLNSGFQMELGFASIGIGIVGFLGFWNRAVWLPFIINKVAFGWGAGFTHILHAIQHNNFNPGNVGIILYWDFIFPTVLIILYILYRREQNTQPPTAAAAV